jgi:hypothetical protein
MEIADPPPGRNMHRPRPGDRVRITFDATVTSVNGDGVTFSGIVATTLHRDFMHIIEYVKEDDVTT